MTELGGCGRRVELCFRPKSYERPGRCWKKVKCRSSSKVLLGCLLKRKELHCCEIVWMVLHCGHNKQDYPRMKNGAGWAVNLAMNIFSLLLEKHSRSHFLASFFSVGSDKKYFNSFLDQYSRWKPRKTVIRVWRLSGDITAAARARE